MTKPYKEVNSSLPIHQMNLIKGRNKLDKKRNRKYEDGYECRKNIFIILKIRYKMKV